MNILRNWAGSIIPGLCLAVAYLSFPAQAYDAGGLASVEDSAPLQAITGFPAQTTDVFRANEGMILRIPLDTGSVLNGAYPIDSAGYVRLPILGRMFIHGKTEAEVQTHLGQKLSSYLKDINIIAAPAIRLTLIGHWQKPGMLYVEAGASVWETCRLVGGPAGEQNLEKWKVMRGTSTLDVSLLDEFSRGSTLRKAGIRSGDIFVIPVPNPQSGFWYWFRESLSVTAQIAGIVGTTLTVYITYLILERDSDLNRSLSPF